MGSLGWIYLHEWYRDEEEEEDMRVVLSLEEEEEEECVAPFPKN